MKTKEKMDNSKTLGELMTRFKKKNYLDTTCSSPNSTSFCVQSLSSSPKPSSLFLNERTPRDFWWEKQYDEIPTSPMKLSKITSIDEMIQRDLQQLRNTNNRKASSVDHDDELDSSSTTTSHDDEEMQLKRKDLFSSSLDYDQKQPNASNNALAAIRQTRHEIDQTMTLVMERFLERTNLPKPDLNQENQTHPTAIAIVSDLDATFQLMNPRDSNTKGLHSSPRSSTKNNLQQQHPKTSSPHHLQPQEEHPNAIPTHFLEKPGAVMVRKEWLHRDPDEFSSTSCANQWLHSIAPTCPEEVEEALNRLDQKRLQQSSNSSFLQDCTCQKEKSPTTKTNQPIFSNFNDIWNQTFSFHHPKESEFHHPKESEFHHSKESEFHHSKEQNKAFYVHHYQDQENKTNSEKEWSMEDVVALKLPMDVLLAMKHDNQQKLLQEQVKHFKTKVSSRILQIEEMHQTPPLSSSNEITNNLKSSIIHQKKEKDLFLSSCDDTKDLLHDTKEIIIHDLDLAILSLKQRLGIDEKEKQEQLETQKKIQLEKEKQQWIAAQEKQKKDKMKHEKAMVRVMGATSIDEIDPEWKWNEPSFLLSPRKKIQDQPTYPVHVPNKDYKQVNVPNKDYKQAMQEFDHLLDMKYNRTFQNQPIRKAQHDQFPFISFSSRKQDYSNNSSFLDPEHGKEMFSFSSPMESFGNSFLQDIHHYSQIRKEKCRRFIEVQRVNA